MMPRILVSPFPLSQLPVKRLSLFHDGTGAILLFGAPRHTISRVPETRQLAHEVFRSPISRSLPPPLFLCAMLPKALLNR